MEHASKVLYDSGHYLQQFGLYDECLEDNLTYTLSLVYKGTDHLAGKYTGLYMGLCLPEECNADDHKVINKTLNMVLSSLGQNFYVGDIVDNPYAFEF